MTKDKLGDLMLSEGEACDICQRAHAPTIEHFASGNLGHVCGDCAGVALNDQHALRAAESQIAALKVDLAAQVKRANDLDARMLAECIDYQNEIEKVERERDEAIAGRENDALLSGDITCFDTDNPGCGRCNRCYEYQRDFAKESLELAQAEIARVRKERDEARSARDQDYVRLAREIEESREAQIAALADLSQEHVLRDEYARLLQKATADFENEARLYCSELKESHAERDNANVAREYEWKRAQERERVLESTRAELREAREEIARLQSVYDLACKAAQRIETDRNTIRSDRDTLKAALGRAESRIAELESQLEACK